MEDLTYYLVPFFKNLGVLCLTIWLVLLGTALRKVGLDAFVFKHWLEQNKQRFISGFVFVFSLSLLMAVSDVAPLFSFFGYDINASPVGLGMSIAGLLIIGVGTKKDPDKIDQEEKVQKIQKDAQEIIKTSADIGSEEKGEE